MAHKYYFTYDQLGNDVSRWKDIGEDLLFSSEQLMKSFYKERKVRSVFLPALMLKAFGIECLLKGVYLVRGNKIVINNKIKKFNAKPHDLVEICKEFNVSISIQEKEMLEQLTATARNIGRYPIAKNINEKSNIIWTEPNSSIALQKFIDKLLEEIYQYSFSR